MSIAPVRPANALQFPDSRVFRGFNAPVRIEADVYDLEVEGEIPASLDGTFFRLAADSQYPPLAGDQDIYLNGDGMMTMVRFANGHADVKTRYVQTDRFKAERAARRSLFGRYRNKFTDDASVAGVDGGTANTSLRWFGGKLFALKEASRPMQIDPHTLETMGWHDFGGALTSQTFTAHPKVDPLSGETIAFSYFPEGRVSNTVEIHTISAGGELTRTEQFDAPYPSMMHDFSVTKNYIIFVIYPMVSNQERIENGGSFFYWDPSHETKIGIIPRRQGVSGIRWYSSPKLVLETHTINAWDEGDKLTVEHFITNSGWYSQFPHVSELNPREEPPFAQRWTFDLSSDADTFDVTQLVKHPGEMPVVDARYLMSRTRHFFFGAINHDLGPMLELGPMGPPFNSLAHYDAADGSLKYFYAGDNSSTQEPVFVPRSPDAGEADGWLIGVVGRHQLNRSDIVVLDTRDLGAGPVATLKVPFRLRYGFHGCWVDRADLNG